MSVRVPTHWKRKWVRTGRGLSLIVIAIGVHAYFHASSASLTIGHALGILVGFFRLVHGALDLGRLWSCAVSVRPHLSPGLPSNPFPFPELPASVEAMES